MFKATKIALQLLLCCVFHSVTDARKFVIASYMPESHFSGDEDINLNETAHYLTDMILFSVRPNVDGTLESSHLDESHYQKAFEASRSDKTKDPVNLWATIGGAGSPSEDFIEAIETSPDNLVLSLHLFVLDHSISGIDFDCESFSSGKDYETYLRWLLQYAVPNLKRWRVRTSVALHADMLLPPELYEIIGRVNLMTYKLLGGGGSHASLPQVQQDVERLIEHGCDPKKIILGIPAYAENSQNPQDTKTFAELVNMAGSKGYAGEFEGYVGDSPDMVAQKVAYAKERKLGGVFFSEMGQDKQAVDVAPGGFLLEAAANAALSFS